MAQVVTQSITVNDTVTETLNFGTVTAVNVQAISQPTYPYSNGTTATAIDYHWEHSYTLASSASTTITLSALTDDIGRTVALARIKRLSVQITAKTDGDTLVMGNATSNPITTLMGGTTPTTTIHLYHLVVSADTGSFVVTSGSADQLKFNNAGSNSMTFTVSISGCSV